MEIPYWLEQTRAISVLASTAPNHGAGPRSTRRVALHSIQVRPIPIAVARVLIELHHYLHSLPGGTRWAFGVFLGNCLLGALSFGAGPFNAYSLVQGATRADCITLSRFWLDDALPKNSESRVLGIVLRALRRHTGVKFLVTYADDSQGHLGTIYQATGWTYTGLSEAMPLYQIEGGKVQHSRSLSHAYGTHSLKHFAGHGVGITVLPQVPKHRYIYFLDPTWRCRLRLASHAYPKSAR